MMGRGGCRSEPVAVSWSNDKECLCGGVCVPMCWGEVVWFLGEEEVVLTGFILILPEGERVGKDFQLRETGSLRS